MYPDDSLFQLGNRRGTGDDYADVDGDQVDMIPPEQIADDSTANNDPNAKNMTALDGTEANVYKNDTNGTSSLTATNNPAANITQEMNRSGAPNGQNST